MRRIDPRLSQVDAHLNDAVAVGLGVREAAAGEDPHHGSVARQCLGNQRADSPGHGTRDEALQ